MLQQYAAKRGGQESLLENMNSKYFYYTRTKGLFRICYPKERPPTGELAEGEEAKCSGCRAATPCRHAQGRVLRGTA